jgi:DNA-binding NarL/FixJ family response regulator
MTGLQAATVLRKSFPGLGILLFTELCRSSLREECLRCGVDGFVDKS